MKKVFILLIMIITLASFASSIDKKISTKSTIDLEIKEQKVPQENAAFGVIPIFDCQTLDIEGATYELQNNIETSEDECFLIETDGVVFDLNGYYVAGGDGAELGVLIDEANFVTIKNGLIANFEQGIYIEEGVNNNILNMNVDSSFYGISFEEVIHAKIIDTTVTNTDRDFYLNNIETEMHCDHTIDNFIGSDGQPVPYYNSAVLLENKDLRGLTLCNADNSIIQDITIDNEEQNGVYVYFTDNSVFSDITIDNTDAGFILISSHKNEITDSFISHVERQGILLERSHNNKISNNHILEVEERSGLLISLSNDNSLFNNVIELTDDAGLYLWQSDNNFISGGAIHNSGDSGLRLDESSQNVIKDISIMNNEHGDLNINSDKEEHCMNTFENIAWTEGRPIEFYNEQVVLKGKDLGGLILCNADGSIIEDLTIDNELQRNGLLLLLTDNAIISNAYVSNTIYGFRLEGNANIITSSTFDRNNENGISLRGNNNIVSSSTSSKSERGLSITGNHNEVTYSSFNNNQENGIFIRTSSNNVIAHNHIERNGLENDDDEVGGIFIDHDTSNNLVYDNFFDNEINFVFDGFDFNMWNVKQELGTNIAGGPFIGGNYWANPDGTGFSQTCEDPNDDGLCDTTHILGDSNIDNLPLASSEVGGVCVGDINEDGVVDGQELVIVLGAWGENPNHPADLNGDGIVDIEDLIIVYAHWGEC